LALALVPLLAGAAACQSARAVFDFEKEALRSTPEGWIVWPPTFFEFVVVDLARQGHRAVVFQPSNPHFRPDIGFATKSISALAFRGDRVRLRAYVRVSTTDTSGRAGLSLAVQRPFGLSGFVGNTAVPVGKSETWGSYDIVGDVSEDAETIQVGVWVRNAPLVWVDDLSLTTLGRAPKQQATSPVARAYLDSALNLMQQHALNRARVHWDTVRARAYLQADGAQSSAETYEAIRGALAALADQHSALRVPTHPSPSDAGPGTTSVNARVVNGQIGFVQIPTFLTIDSVESRVFARAMQNAIARIDSTRPCGWVVDLRENHGGNMWPMLAGIGPILGEGVAGAFLSGRERTEWSYVGGQARENDKSRVEVPGIPYRLSEPNPGVAILLGDGTASSGEVIAISFVGRPNARSFGTPTFGLSTANYGYQLPDSALLLLTTAVDVDRTGTRYGGSVFPNEVVRRDALGAGDSVLDAAVRWLTSSKSCGG
jgi:C-terminal processing protease CtpA/Prc